MYNRVLSRKYTSCCPHRFGPSESKAVAQAEKAYAFCGSFVLENGLLLYGYD